MTVSPVVRSTRPAKLTMARPTRLAGKKRATSSSVPTPFWKLMTIVSACRTCCSSGSSSRRDQVLVQIRQAPSRSPGPPSSPTVFNTVVGRADTSVTPADAQTVSLDLIEARVAFDDQDVAADRGQMGRRGPSRPVPAPMTAMASRRDCIAIQCRPVRGRPEPQASSPVAASPYPWRSPGSTRPASQAHRPVLERASTSLSSRS